MLHKDLLCINIFYQCLVGFLLNLIIHWFFQILSLLLLKISDIILKISDKETVLFCGLYHNHDMQLIELSLQTFASFHEVLLASIWSLIRQARSSCSFNFVMSQFFIQCFQCLFSSACASFPVLVAVPHYVIYEYLAKDLLHIYK